MTRGPFAVISPLSCPPSETMPEPAATPVAVPPAPRVHEDWLAILLGLGFLVLCAVLVAASGRVTNSEYQNLLGEQRAARAAEDSAAVEKLKKEVEGLEKRANPLTAWIGRPGAWSTQPLQAFEGKQGSLVPVLLATAALLGLLFGVGIWLRGESLPGYLAGLVGVFLLALLAFLVSTQEKVSYLNLEYALWALFIGLTVTNLLGLPQWLKPAARTEFYIKTGLVMFGAEVLFGRLLELGPPGLMVAWIVTPIVLISTYLFGQYVLKIESKSLNLVVSADMSVCGVSAAIATAAACKAKKEELSLAISISLFFTVIMMVVQPFLVRWWGLSEEVGGAWIGGTIDSSGAVIAAGKAVGPRAMEVAATVKMVQNILIGVVSLAVASYWVTFVERDATAPTPGIGEIWRRFPKFVLGFLAASVISSWLISSGPEGRLLGNSVLAASKGLKEWCFCLGFVSIGLESNLRELARTLQGGKPLLLYVCGQSFNLALTLLMAYVAFGR